MNTIHFRNGLAAILIGVASLAGHAQTSVRESLLSAPCVISVAHGRNASKDDPRFNGFWNAMNSGVQQFVGERLGAEGIKVFEKLYSVESDSMQEKSQWIATVVAASKCTFVLELAVYAPRSGEVIVDIAMKRLILGGAGSPRQNAVFIGPRAYGRQYVYDATGNFMQTFVFSTVGKQYAEEMLRSPVEP